MISKVRTGNASLDSLSGKAAFAGRVALLAAAVLVPFNLVLNDLAGRDLHLTMVSVGCALGLAALRLVTLPSIKSLRSLSLLDLTALTFLLWSVFHLGFLGEPHPRAFKGFLIETRIAWIYLAARVLAVDVIFVRRLLNLFLVLTIFNAAWGFFEYRTDWGRLLRIGDRVDHPKYWKLGVPRLYSPVITPAQTGYFLYGGLCAAAARWVEGARALPAAAVVGATLGILMTLTRTAIASAVAAILFFPLLRRELRSFFPVAVLGGLLSLGLLHYTGILPNLSTYATTGGATLEDPSARVHREAVRSGFEVLRDRPLGFGFGHAGHVAMEEGGRFRWNETYFLTLGAQAGLPAMAITVVMLCLSGVIGARAALGVDRERAAVGTFVIAFLVGTIGGSLFLPTASSAWVQVYLFPAVAALVNERRREAVDQTNRWQPGSHSVSGRGR